MTRLTKPNKRDVKKSTPVAETATPTVVVGPNVVDAKVLTYRELQAEAKSLGLKASGTKADLIARLA